MKGELRGVQVKGGAAETDGRLCAGDQILTVNGEDLRDVTQQYAAKLLKVRVFMIYLGARENGYKESREKVYNKMYLLEPSRISLKCTPFALIVIH